MNRFLKSSLPFALALILGLPGLAAAQPSVSPDLEPGVARLDSGVGSEAESEGEALGLTRWLAAQLLPSLELTHGRHGSAWGLGWEVTPLALSFGGASPTLRSFYVEPGLRHGGTVELVTAGDYFDLRGEQLRTRERFVFRAGVRTYLPLGSVAPHTSLSLGLSYYDGFGTRGLLYETGLNLFDERASLRFAFVAHSTTPQYIWSFRIQSF